MRWYLTLICIINISCVLVIFFFIHELTFRRISPDPTNILIEPWRLLARNNERLIKLYKKYNLLLNITAFKTNQLSDKTMIYSCKSFCGGWGDRLRGITSVYILALLTNRRFMIDMNYPCEILKVLQPNLVNWTYIQHNQSKNRSRLYINTMRSWQISYRNEIYNLIKSKDFIQIWSLYDDVSISTNADYITPALRNPYMLNKTRKLLGQISVSHATMRTLFSFIFEILFKPTTIVRKKVDSILSMSYYKHLICLHIRIGKNPTNPYDHAFTNRMNTTRIMLDFVDKYLLKKSSRFIFVTSDSSQDVTNVLKHYPNSSMTITGPILHIDRFDQRSSIICDGFLKVLADFYLLGECQTSILSKSGFSSWANERRIKPNEELYIYDERSNKITKMN